MEKRRRKRPRMTAGCLTLASLLLLAAPSCHAFSLVPRNTILQRTRLVLFESKTGGALVLDSPDTVESEHEYDFATPKLELPPWLQRLESYTEEDAMIHLDWLEYALLEEGFSFDDISDVIHAVQETAQGDVARVVGCVNFLRLLLQLKDDGDKSFCSKQVLLASVLHFSDCITVRETGVYEMVKRAIHGRHGNDGGYNSYRALAPASSSAEQKLTDPDDETYDDITRSLISATRRQELYTDEVYNEYGQEAVTIARDAARVKRAEILAHAVLDVGRKPSKEEASRLRGLLLSVMDDWRALAIRAVACLFRLEGILHDAEASAHEYVSLSPETVKATREALHVYAPLAQRLGMQRLKAKLEDRAFRILYRRQYNVVSTLFGEHGAEMALVSSDLSSSIEQVLRQTPSLMEQLEDLKVTSRVKEPYSLWKKLLKQRHKGKMLPPSLKGTTETIVGSSDSSSELSLLDVQDGIAVRIILRARKWTPDEPDEITRNRERLLCYYVTHVLRSYWPVVDSSRIKDYIRYPKPNGYQSLHYTSATSGEEGQTWPFEVQVRSEEMHRIAEYGVAAHWDYKLGDKRIELLSPSLSSVEEDGSVQTLTSSDVIVKEDDTAIVVEEAPVLEDSYIDALVTARERLMENKIFVFFAGSSAIDNMGQLLSLRVGARVEDAILELKDQLDLDRELENVSILKNGRDVKNSDFVGNGDVLLISL